MKKNASIEKIPYRVCFKHGREDLGLKLYEVYQRCHCNECETRYRKTRQPHNQATATTAEYNNIENVVNQLKKWQCADGTKRLPVEYFEY